MDYYRVEAGKHVERQANGKLKTWKKGELIQSDRDLVAAYANKFVKVHPNDIPVSAANEALERAKKAREEAKAKVRESEPEEEDDLPPEPEEEDEAAGLGTDVTKKFDAVHSDGRLTVHYDGESYSLAQDGESVGGPFDKRGVVEFFKKWKKSNPK